MKLLRRAGRLEVKRAFLITPFMRKFGIAGRYDVTPPTRAQYLAALARAKRAVAKLTEKQLDRQIGFRKRIRGYDTAQWFVATVSLAEVGVWKGAGGLPVAWTHGSLAETARKVRVALQKNGTEVRRRAKRAIPAILQFRSIMKKEPYLYPIVFESGFGTNGRKGVRKMKGDIDDGCMRSIAFAVAGDKMLKVYFGLRPT